MMKKDLGVVQAVWPMPVLMVAAYDENEKVNVMNAAWGQICDEDKIILFIGEGKRTWLNIKASKAFTVALADYAETPRPGRLTRREVTRIFSPGKE